MGSSLTLNRCMTGFRVLIVDDSFDFKQLLALTLGTISSIKEIDFANNGKSAMEKAMEKYYDLIYLDVMMPEIDGYETCTCLRALIEYKDTPIIMVSGNDTPFDEAKGIISGCTTYVTKPIQQIPFLKLSNHYLSLLELRENLKKDASPQTF